MLGESTDGQYMELSIVVGRSVVLYVRTYVCLSVCLYALRDRDDDVVCIMRCNLYVRSEVPRSRRVTRAERTNGRSDGRTSRSELSANERTIADAFRRVQRLSVRRLLQNNRKFIVLIC
jgi:hypothetical protein